MEVSTLLAALLASLSALAGVYLTNRANTTQMRIQLAQAVSSSVREHREKHAEELFILLEEWCRAVNLDFSTWYDAMLGDLTIPQAAEYRRERGFPSTERVAKINMLVKLYFPSGASVFGTASDAFSEGVRLINSTISAQDAPNHSYAEGMRRSITELNGAVSELQRLLGREIRALEQVGSDAVNVLPASTIPMTSTRFSRNTTRALSGLAIVSAIVLALLAAREKPGADGRWTASVRMEGSPNTMQIEIVVRESKDGVLDGFGRIGTHASLPFTVRGFRAHDALSVSLSSLDGLPQGILVGSVRGNRLTGKIVWSERPSPPDWPVIFSRQ